LSTALDGYKTPAIKAIIRAGSVAALEHWRNLERVDGRHELMIEICLDQDGQPDATEIKPTTLVKATKPRKATKTQGQEAYDYYHGILRCHNGGTVTENERNARHCYERMTKQMKVIEAIIANPGKLLRNSWYWEALTVSIPKNYAGFPACYPHILEGDVPDNLLQFNA